MNYKIGIVYLPFKILCRFVAPQSSNMAHLKLYTFLKYGLFLLFISNIIGCKPTRWVGEDEYLLNQNKIIVEDNSHLDTKEIEGYIRQKPNKKLFFIFRMNLAAYNYAQRGKKKGPVKRWLEKTIGEEPSIYDSLLVHRTVNQFNRYLENNAYYKGNVRTEVNFKGKKVQVNYIIHTSDPLYVESVKYIILDSGIAKNIFADTARAHLHPQATFTLENMQSERNRISDQLRDSGYYYFNNDYVRYIVDTSNYKARVNIEVQKAIQKDSAGVFFRTPHKKYWVNQIYFYPNFRPQEAIKNRQVYFNSLDTLQYGDYTFLYDGKPNVKPKTILKAENLMPGQLYSLTNVKNTSKYLNSLRLFRLNNISFTRQAGSDSLLNCHVQLTPFTYQDYSVSFEMTNTKGNIGIGGSFKYRHKNLFKGAELFQLKLTGSNQFVSKTEDREAFNILEAGAEASLDIPSFLIPFKTENFYKKYNPKTSFSMAANYQLRPDFKRLIYSASMGYKWKASNYVNYNINAIDLSTVKVTDMSTSFENDIKGTYLENNYKDYFIAGGRYSFIYQDATDTKRRNHTFFRWNFEFAGNLFYSLDKYLLNRDTTGTGGYYSIFGLPYAQFAKTDMDLRYYQPLSQNQSFAYRAYAGVAVPYGNTNAVPFIRQFSAGGADGMRAWQIKDLGPGTYNAPDSTFPNQMSDIKIEFNMEYRFDIARHFKGAAFVDIGNIWSISEEDERPGAAFDVSKFYRQFAFGTGLGARYDIKFAVIRLDAAVKMRDPSISDASTWILFNRPFKFNHINWNFAIGYPF